MRARNLKPGIFKNEFLAVADPIYTLIFEGLWCLADREGRLEDRPAKIHMEINPGRAFETTESSLSWLASKDFIHRYCIGQARYIQVIKFSEHQNPHQKEPPSKIPAPSASTVLAPVSNVIPTSKPDAGTGQAPDKHETGIGTVQCEQQTSTVLARLTPSSLTPDSGLLIPESSLRESLVEPERSTTRAAKKVSHETDPDWMLDFKLAYPDRAGDQGWRKAVRAANARIAEGHTPDEFLAGAKRYAAYCEATEKTGTEFVKQACTFLGPDKHFTQLWAAPKSNGNGQHLTKFDRQMARSEANRLYDDNGNPVDEDGNKITF